MSKSQLYFIDTKYDNLSILIVKVNHLLTEA